MKHILREELKGDVLDKRNMGWYEFMLTLELKNWLGRFCFLDFLLGWERKVTKQGNEKVKRNRSSSSSYTKRCVVAKCVSDNSIIFPRKWNCTELKGESDYLRADYSEESADEWIYVKSKSWERESELCFSLFCSGGLGEEQRGEEKQMRMNWENKRVAS